MIIKKDDVLQTPEALKEIESEWLQQLNGTAIAWFGRAATSLYWAYRAVLSRRVEVSQPEVILPAISCGTLANVALMAGFTPRFADIDPQTGLASLESIQSRWTPRTCAVVFVHLFGQTIELRPLAAWCRSKEVTLIEDAAQALNAQLPDSSPAGSVGDLSVYSFNPSKILECGGGALVVRSESLWAALEREFGTYASLPELDSTTSALLSLSYRNLHHALVALLRLNVGSGVSELFLRVRAAYDSLYLRPIKNSAALATAWQQRASILEQRYRKAELYTRKLADGPWQLLDGWSQSKVCWRYSLLVDFPDQLADFSEAVRRDRFHLSNLYWPTNQFFRPNDACPNADFFARRIVNLWVDNSVTPSWIEQCSSSLVKHATKIAQS